MWSKISIVLCGIQKIWNGILMEKIWHLPIRSKRLTGRAVRCWNFLCVSMRHMNTGTASRSKSLFWDMTCWIVLLMRFVKVACIWTVQIKRKNAGIRRRKPIRKNSASRHKKVVAYCCTLNRFRLHVAGTGNIFLQTTRSIKSAGKTSRF